MQINYPTVMNSASIKTGILGASGYTGGELLRYLESHPEFRVTYVAAGSSAGEKISFLHPQLRTLGGRELNDQTFSEFDLKMISELDLLFIALPHGESSKLTGMIPDSVKIIDLGADFRLSNAEAWMKYYGGDYSGKWTYGLPESPGRRHEIASSTRVANPGCYATAITLSLVPLIQNGAIVQSDITVVAASGTTGAGRSAKRHLLASEVMNSMTSYKFGGVHQHTPEIEQELELINSSQTQILFTPILAPMPRGILATTTAKSTLNDPEELTSLYRDYYEEEPFIRILSDRLPQTSSVLGSNHCEIALAYDPRTERVVISAAIDNLGKGAAGQAIQNANIVFGLPETSGLSSSGLGI